jgi:hypothetical protein
MPEDFTQQIWCADFTESATGEVGLIEIPGEASAFNIAPGAPAYSPSDHGILQPITTMPPWEFLYNIMQLPGWQKWMPTFRYGVITSLNDDKTFAAVLLNNATSSQQSLEINQSDVLSNVSFDYMDIGGALFREDDVVLISFVGQKWASPVIIGYKDNPLYQYTWFWDMGSETNSFGTLHFADPIENFYTLTALSDELGEYTSYHIHFDETFFHMPMNPWHVYGTLLYRAVNDMLRPVPAGAYLALDYRLSSIELEAIYRFSDDKGNDYYATSYISIAVWFSLYRDGEYAGYKRVWFDFEQEWTDDSGAYNLRIGPKTDTFSTPRRKILVPISPEDGYSFVPPYISVHIANKVSVNVTFYRVGVIFGNEADFIAQGYTIKDTDELYY